MCIIYSLFLLWGASGFFTRTPSSLSVSPALGFCFEKIPYTLLCRWLSHLIVWKKQDAQPFVKCLNEIKARISLIRRLKSCYPALMTPNMWILTPYLKSTANGVKLYGDLRFDIQVISVVEIRLFLTLFCCF